VTGPNGVLLESTSPWAAEHWPLSGASQARRPACAASEILLSQRRRLPLGVYFNMKSTKKPKTKTKPSPLSVFYRVSCEESRSFA